MQRIMKLIEVSLALGQKSQLYFCLFKDHINEKMDISFIKRIKFHLTTLSLSYLLNTLLYTSVSFITHSSKFHTNKSYCNINKNDKYIYPKYLTLHKQTPSPIPHKHFFYLHQTPSTKLPTHTLPITAFFTH